MNELEILRDVYEACRGEAITHVDSEIGRLVVALLNDKQITLREGTVFHNRLKTLPSTHQVWNFVEFKAPELV